jgi:tetrahydromethanopterin S-methyltransferase subunit H
MEQASAASGIDYKFTTRFEVLDGGNGVAQPIALETWEIYGCYLQAVDYGNMAYNESAPATIAMTIRFDNALQTPIGSGVGATIGRTVNDVATGAG